MKAAFYAHDWPLVSNRLSFSDVNVNSVSHVSLLGLPHVETWFSLLQLLVTRFQEDVFTVQEACFVLDVPILRNKDQKAV